MKEKNKRRGFEISPESVEEFNLSPKDLKQYKDEHQATEFDFIQSNMEKLIDQQLRGGVLSPKVKKLNEHIFNLKRKSDKPAYFSPSNSDINFRKQVLEKA